MSMASLLCRLNRDLFGRCHHAILFVDILIETKEISKGALVTELLNKDLIYLLHYVLVQVV